ncbi:MULTISPECIES: helix-turn-helix transcriptional regulator [Halorubrum]|uniref:PadR family transcriptional regulator n=1 Tax=Halorubrum tropicale TaxID=1765655 RepID=A0A0N1IUV2_9EURY|nr:MULTISPECIES: helix-turn-helix transcriptional regulator [Halorubrum]KOX95940.1 PadR family transcriptional regulator [Halorubrum tropicale]TKX43861.1 PadR family transcriptional regulator [Halorubrum sp. ARQ200]
MSPECATDCQTLATLTAFQRDLLRTLAKTDEQSGLSLKTDLTTYYGEAINHSRLYQNLDELVRHGLINKRQRDGRTNSYSLTDAAQTALAKRDAWIRGETA